MQKAHKFKLKELAHNTIAAKLGVEDLKNWKFEEPEFREKRGVFVTLEIEGELRGCIGNIEPVHPLWQAVQRNAHEAAFGDPRFPALTEDEFEKLDIEISILTVPEKTSVEQIEPSIDGVVVEQGGYKATYLPQVWDDIPEKEQFLSSLCLKAGLEPEAWKDDETVVYTYQVEKF